MSDLAPLLQGGPLGGHRANANLSRHTTRQTAAKPIKP